MAADLQARLAARIAGCRFVSTTSIRSAHRTIRRSSSSTTRSPSSAATISRRCRWDTSDHAHDDPRRVDHRGDPLSAVPRRRHRGRRRLRASARRARARALAARDRRAAPAKPRPRPRRTCGRRRSAIAATDVDVAIARTEPAFDGDAGRRRRSAQLHLDAIAAARRHIFAENQYFTSRTDHRRVRAAAARGRCAGDRRAVAVHAERLARDFDDGRAALRAIHRDAARGRSSPAAIASTVRRCPGSTQRRLSQRPQQGADRRRRAADDRLGESCPIARWRSTRNATSRIEARGDPRLERADRRLSRSAPRRASRLHAGRSCATRRPRERSLHRAIASLADGGEALAAERSSRSFDPMPRRARARSAPARSRAAARPGHDRRRSRSARRMPAADTRLRLVGIVAGVVLVGGNGIGMALHAAAGVARRSID